MRNKYILNIFNCLLLSIILSLFSSTKILATQLSGSYTIDSTQTASTTNFRNLNSAITYLTSAGNRSDGGPANSSPFGVSGPVEFNYTGSVMVHTDQVVIPVITGVSATNTVTINGNGRTIQFQCNTSNYAVVRFAGADYVRFKNLTIKTTDVTNGWGIHFYQGADYNIIDSCTIDLTTVTSTSNVTNAGIVFSNSTTSAITSGINGYFNIVSNCTIKGHPTSGGMHYGVVGFPSSSAANLSNNQFLNNTIENFYSYGFYWGNGNRTVFRNNKVHRPSKSTITTTYGFYFTGGSRADTIDANIITNLFGGNQTSTSTTYGIYGINYSGTAAEPNSFTNNLMYDFKGNGTQSGFYFLTGFNNRFYNNTVSFDHTFSTATGATYGFYWSGNTSTTSTLDFRNNIIYITRGGTGAKFALFTTGNWSVGSTLNKNGYYGNALNYNAVSYLGLNYPTYNNWKAANTTLDQNSSDYPPVFVDLATGNLSPQDAWYSGNGDTISYVNYDVYGATRNLPLDIGSINGTPVALDVAFANINVPASPFSAGVHPISAILRNAGSTAITSATINWTVNGVAQTPVVFSGTIAPGNFSAPIALGNITIATGVLYDIVGTVSNPNNGTDAIPDNNSAAASTASSLSGTFTLNKNIAASGTNYTSASDFANILSIGGVGGAVTLNVVANSGPYTEQVFFRNVIGTSTNNITINGNNEYIQFNNTDATTVGIINLIGSDNFTFNNLNVRSLNLSYGIGYLLTGGSDTNTINNCIIDISSVTGGSLSAGIAVTGALNTATSGAANTGHFNKFINNTITGGATGGPYYGITLLPTNTTTNVSSNNIIENNIIRDVTVYGMYLNYTTGTIIRNNVISRPTKASPSTFYGMYFINGNTGDTIDRNVIKQPCEALQTSTSTVYGIYFATPNVQAARPNLLSNNLIYDFKSNGAMYGIYSSNANYTKYYHNTVVIDHATSTATGVGYLYYHTGTPTSITFSNNIFFLNRGGTGNKFVYYLATTGTGYSINNNAVHVKNLGSNNTHTGYYAGNFTTFANWKTANGSAFDQQSTNADPQFRTYINPEFYQPGNDSLNNVGANVLADVPFDFTGAPRSATPDLGAYEFTVPAVDAGLTRISSPTSPINLGFLNVDVNLKNFGTSNLSSVQIGWTVNDTAQFPYYWTGFLNPSDTAVVAIGNYNFANPGFYKIKAWSFNPNTQNDSLTINDTTTLTVCTPVAGNVTINGALASGGNNFNTFNEFFSALKTCGVAGTITASVMPGTYNEQVSIVGNIIGSSSLNKIKIIGTDSATCILKHNASVLRPTLLLNDVKNLEFRNLRIETEGVSNGTAVQLINSADSNAFVKCTFVAPYSTGINTNAFVASGNIAGPTTQGNSANALLIDSCNATGGYYAIDLYGSTTFKSVGNIVRNSKVTNSHFYGIYGNYQDGIKITNNLVQDIGIVGNNISTTLTCIAVLNSNNGIRILNNEIQNTLAGRGIDISTNLGTTTDMVVVANNMVNIGAASNTTYGIYEVNNANLDLAYNTIKLNTAEPNYAGAAWYSNNTVPATYTNNRIVNNIFTAPSGALSVYIVNGPNLSPANYTIDNNVYYSTSTYPFRVGGFITNTLNAFATGTPNMLGTFLPGNNQHGQFFMPNFFSSTNLRSVSPELDDSAMVIATVTTDFDGRTRSTMASDIGIYEFSKPANDAGVIAIVDPKQPMLTGLNNIRVVIKNFGTNTLTSTNVNYRIDTVLHTTTYTGSLATGSTDTVAFNATSGPGATSQQFNFLGNLVDIKSWTSMPNTVLDSLNVNDTAYASICGSLVGNYTINPNGSGPLNFLSIQAAVDKLICGGIAGNVVFNISPGTYNGQISIPTIVGADFNNTITFKSSTNNAADVIITTSNASVAANFTLQGMGMGFVNFENITFSNTHSTFSRIISFNKETTTNTNCTGVSFRGCIFNGNNISSTADQYALVYGPTGDNATFLSFAHCTFNFGSISLTIGGQNIVNQNAPGLNIDTCTFNTPYYAAIWLQNRFTTNIRNNQINLHPVYTNSYGIYIVGLGLNSEISRNTIINPAGNYGIMVQQNSYYDAPGFLTIHSNLVHLQSLNTTQYGLYIANSSKIRIYNNTIRLNTATTGYAFYHSGNATFINGTTNYPASNDIVVKNNLFAANNGFAMYNVNVQANDALAEINRNVYWSNSANTIYLAAINYNTANFYSTYLNALYPGSDLKSKIGNIDFVSNTNSKPNPASTNVWLLNGRAEQIFGLNKDLEGTTKSAAVVTGAPDIGAYEVIPTIVPVNAIITDSINWGSSQYIIDNNDTIAKLTWGLSGMLPTAITAKYFPGTLVSDPTNNGTNNSAHFMDAYWKIFAVGGSGYTYDLNINYDPIHLGKVPNYSDIKMAHKYDTANGTWRHYTSVLTTVDTVNHVFGVTNLYQFGDFTGTTDFSPLPVRLSSFNATRNNLSAILNWVTASEVNAHRFEVERADNNRKFEKIGTISAAGNSTSNIRYQFNDEYAARKINGNTAYYRLKMIDLDGSFTYTETKAVNFDNRTSSTSLAAYPNPFNSDLNLAIASEVDAPVMIEIYDLTGRKIAAKQSNVVAGGNTINIAELTESISGVYIIKAIINGQEFTEKIIKE